MYVHGVRNRAYSGVVGVGVRFGGELPVFTDQHGRVWRATEATWEDRSEGLYLEGQFRLEESPIDNALVPLPAPWKAGLEKIKEGERRDWKRRRDSAKIRGAAKLCGAAKQKPA